MRIVEIGTEHLPPKERFPYWLDMVFSSHTRSLIRTQACDDFRAASLVLDLGTITTSLLTLPPISADRSAKMIRQSDPEAILLHLPLTGGGRVAQRDHRDVFACGDMIVYDSSAPLHVEQNADAGRAQFLLVEIPRSVLQPLAPGVLDLVATSIDGRRGLGAVLTRYLGELLRNASTYSPSDAVALAGVTVDLVAAICAQRCDPSTLPRSARQRALLASIQDYIGQRLGDPALTPITVAAAHYISVRQLHKLFQIEGGLTVAASIRGHRLEKCRRALTDPRQHHLAVGDIAARWGFPDAAHFARLFRAAYGTSPNDYRRLHLDLE